MRYYQRVVCADGFSMSVQANESLYCEPRESNARRYSAVEVGFPSEREELLAPWAENPHKPTKTFYGWVPSEIVAHVIAKHGGMLRGEVPPGVIATPAYPPDPGRRKVTSRK